MSPSHPPRQPNSDRARLPDDPGGRSPDTGRVANSPASGQAAEDQVSSAMLAHDARQSLAAIEAHLALIQDAEDPDDVARHLEHMAGESARLADLFSAELVRADVGAGAGTDLHRLVVELLGRYPWVRLVYSSRTARPFRADPVALRRIVSNLLENAVEAAGDVGDVLVTVDENADRASITVEDTGPGFPSLPPTLGIGLQSVLANIQPTGSVRFGRSRTLGGARVRCVITAVCPPDTPLPAGPGELLQ